jgi:truncated hemoglobin YjbI
MSPFDRIGGEPTLRAIIDRFVDRIFQDMIIGFLFTGKDPARIRQHEYEHAALSLGASLVYTGQPIVPLHRALRINAGQFRRRLAILRQEIDRAGVPEDIRDAWLVSQQRMQAAITDGTDCV